MGVLSRDLKIIDLKELGRAIINSQREICRTRADPSILCEIAILHLEGN